MALPSHADMRVTECVCFIFKVVTGFVRSIFFSVIIVSFCILSKYSFFGALWKHRWSQKGLIHGLSNVLKVKSSARCVCACPTVSFSWSD